MAVRRRPRDSHLPVVASWIKIAIALVSRVKLYMFAIADFGQAQDLGLPSVFLDA